jgi:hypothetical protein
MQNRGLCLLLGVLVLSGCTSKATANTPAPPDTTCAEASKAVQNYRAPGQKLTVGAMVLVTLASERRPVQRHGWEEGERAGQSCLVRYRATIGNERQSYFWTWTPATGKVEARDDATKRLSGW